MTSNIDGDNEMQAQATLEMQADELLKPYEGIYTDKQLQRKSREMDCRILSRQIIQDYVSEEFTDIDDTFIESMMGDIRDAANRMGISSQDFEMVVMRSKKLSYTDIAMSVDLPVKTCYDRLQRAREKILQWDRFGYWEDVLSMESCLSSTWYPMFREMILWCAAGRPKCEKEKNRAQAKK